MKKIDYPHSLIAKEGWLFIAVCLLLVVIVMIFQQYLISIILLLITIFVIQFFRDPPRATHAQLADIVAPADGRVVTISNCINPYNQEQAKKISIFMNVFNVHSQRMPVAGQVMSINYNAGKFINASLDKSSVDNERNAVVLKLNNGEEVTVVQIAGLIARRILCYVSEKEQVTLGQRYGFIRFGSRVDLYLPVNTKIKVGLGEKVSATTTVLASFVD